jgi:intein/homing endonuclease
MAEIWTEKYRPKKFSEIKGQQDIVKRVKAFVETKNMPHLLFSGPAGTGKCVVAETPILTGEGDLMRIDEAYNTKIDSVMSLDQKGKINKAKIAYLYKDEADKLIKATLQTGQSVTATKEHPFLVLKNGEPKWVQAKDLSKSDFVAQPTTYSVDPMIFTIDWSILDYWVELKEQIKVKPNIIYLGVKKKVLECLENIKAGTNREISILINEKKNVVEWAARELIKEGILISKGKKPLKHSLKNNYVLTKTVPFSYVEDHNNIKYLFYKSKLCSIMSFATLKS